MQRPDSLSVGMLSKLLWPRYDNEQMRALMTHDSVRNWYSTVGGMSYKQDQGLGTHAEISSVASTFYQQDQDLQAAAQ